MITRALNIRWVVAAVAVCVVPSLAQASHGQAVVSDIDGNGNGTFTANYTHASGPNVDHPWYTFNAVAGSTVTISLNTPGWSSYLWVYEVVDGNAQVGDKSAANGGTDLILKSQSGGGASTTINFVAPTTNQYIIQVDSFLGGSGAYSLTVSGASGSASAVPEPASMSLLALGAVGMGAYRLRLRRRTAAEGETVA